METLRLLACCDTKMWSVSTTKYNKSRVTLGLHGFAMLGSLLGLRRRLGIVWRLGEVYGMYLLRRGGLGLGIEDASERTIVVFPLSR